MYLDELLFVTEHLSYNNPFPSDLSNFIFRREKNMMRSISVTVLQGTSFAKALLVLKLPVNNLNSCPSFLLSRRLLNVNCTSLHFMKDSTRTTEDSRLTYITCKNLFHTQRRL